MKMRAAILYEQNKPLVVDEVTLPDTLQVGQVLVKVHYSGICGSQLGEIQGIKGEDPYLPHLLGHEGAGIVMEVGPGVKSVSPNDHVVLHWMRGEGIEATPPSYICNGQTVNAGYLTTFNEMTVVSENRVTAIDKRCDLKTAALFGCAVTTAFGAVKNNAHLNFGDSVAILGTGGIGLSLIIAAKLINAYPIIAMDIHESKLELAKSMGATHIVNTSQKSISDFMDTFTQSKGCDVVFETTGKTDLIEAALDITHCKGRVVLVGVPHFLNRASISTLPLHLGKTLVGSHGGETDPSEDIPKYIRMIKAGILELDPIITDIVDLMNVNTAIDRLKKGEIAGRCILRC